LTLLICHCDGSCLKSCKLCSLAEIPDDVANFFNSRQLSVVLRGEDDDDDDVGLLQLDSETRVEDSRSHTATGNVFSSLCLSVYLADGRHLGFGPTGSGSIRSADLKNRTLEPNMKWIG